MTIEYWEDKERVCIFLVLGAAPSGLPGPFAQGGELRYLIGNILLGTVDENMGVLEAR